MASIWQVTWRWTGFPGAPGFTNLFYAASTAGATEALAAATKSRLLFDGVKSYLPTIAHLQLVTDVRLLEDTTGDLVDIFTVSGITDVNGTANTPYSAPVGMCVDWLSTTIHRKHRLQGRTFFVPMTNFHDVDGSPGGAAVTAVATAAEAMRTSGSGPVFGIWGRPVKAKPLATPPVLPVAGLWAPATGSRVPDKTVVLRSRRD